MRVSGCVRGGDGLWSGRAGGNMKSKGSMGRRAGGRASGRAGVRTGGQTDGREDGWADGRVARMGVPDKRADGWLLPCSFCWIMFLKN